jgi:hypothetical protein
MFHFVFAPSVNKKADTVPPGFHVSRDEKFSSRFRILPSPMVVARGLSQCLRARNIVGWCLPQKNEKMQKNSIFPESVTYL